MTYGEPFGNGLLTGAQVERMLEQQFCGINAPANGGFPRVLPSAGLRYTYTAWRAVLREGTDRVGGVVDTDAFEACLAANAGGSAPPATDRIDLLP